jgi:hypothetical protein
MKKFLPFLLITLISVTVKAQFKNNKEPFQVKSLSNESFTSTEVRTSGGSISVTGVNASEVRVEVYISSNNSKDELSKEEIQQRLTEMYDLEIKVVNNKLIATAKSKEKIKDWKMALNIGFKLFVPEKTETDLNTSGGSISISKMSGNQSFGTSGGSLNIDNVTGKVNGRTSGGSINLENSTNDVELSTSGGSINASHCTGKIRLSTSGGSLNLEDLDGDIRASTSGGSIGGKNIGGEFSGHTSGGSIRLYDLTCSLEASTSAGSIHVSMKSLGKYIKLSNSGGHIDLDIPKGKGANLDLSGNKIKTDEMNNFSGKMSDDEIDGKLNGGGIPITINAGSGRITLGFK